MSPKGREREIATAEYVPISMHVLESNVQIEYISLVVNDHSVLNTFPDIAMVVKRERSSTISKAIDFRREWVMRLECKFRRAIPFHRHRRA